MLPKLKELPTRRQIVDAFRGYNHNHNTAEGEAYEMRNMTSDHYPLAASRAPRGLECSFHDIGGILMKEKLWIVRGSTLTDFDHVVDLGLTETTPDNPKRLIGMGAYIIVLPDRKYLNTADLSDYGDIDHTFRNASEVRVYPCRVDGEEITGEHISPEEPENPKDGTYWVNTSEYPNRLYQWSAVSEVWTKIQTSTVRIFALKIGEGFEVGDGITISGFDTSANHKTFPDGKELSEAQIKQLRELDGANVIVDRDRDWIVVSGIVDAHVELGGVITITRGMPEMDFVVEHKNRLWGCRYGLDAGGENVNILYASKLGDFKNWTCFQGVETDSYYAHVGSDGPFTGAISYGDAVIFSKENGLHLVYGDGPGSFQTQLISGPGVQKGSGESMVIVGGTVFYKGIKGVYAFDGSLPVSVGYCLGNEPYSGAVAGSHGGKYVISMLDGDQKPNLFCYDTDRRLWHREDELRVCAMVSGGGVLYMLGADGRVHTVGAAGEEVIEWCWQTGIIGAETPDRKRLMRLNVRAQMEIGGRMKISARYDSTGGWQHIGTVAMRTMRAEDTPVRVRRCDHLELRFEGSGGVRIRSITKVFEEGSDLR